MNIVGIVAEYNPFHNGHAYHLQQSKRMSDSEHVVVVMSGNFTQRGEPAIVDKYCRTKMALLGGADLVVELPVCYATASAEYFAKGAVNLLCATGIVNHMCFGSECGDIKPLHNIADLLMQEERLFKQALKIELDKGSAFPRARQDALRTMGIHDGILQSPNNILAVAYLMALGTLGSAMKAHTIPRKEAAYHDTRFDGTISSATAIRHAVGTGDIGSLARVMPTDSLSLLKEQLTEGVGAAKLDNLSSLLRHIVNTNNLQWLKNIQDVTEGLENRIVKSVNRHYYIGGIISEVKTKRYTFTRIQRIMLHCLLNLTQELFLEHERRGGPQYIRVLGFRRQSAHLLKAIEQHASLPFVTNLKHARNVLNPYALSMLEKEIETTDIYYLSTDNGCLHPQPKHVEYKKPIVIV